MKKFRLVFFVSLMMVTMFGCVDNSSDNNMLSLLLMGEASGGEPELQGMWTTSCLNGQKYKLIINGDRIDDVHIRYINPNCQGMEIRDNISYLYRVGNEVTDTDDQQMDKEIDFGFYNHVVYSLYRLSDNKLYLRFGDFDESKRPTTINHESVFVYEKE